jgi:hypothetical protein
MTGEEIQKWLAEKYPHYRYTKRQVWDFLRHGSNSEDPIFMIVNKFRATGDLNRWAIRPEIEPQLRQWYDPPLPQPPILQSSGDHCQLAPAAREVASAVLCEPQIGSKQTALWESPLATMLGIKQPFPHPTLPSDFIEKPLTDQPIGKHQRTSYQEASTPARQPLSIS